MSEAKRSPAQPRLLTPQTIDSFMCLMADMLRLPDETLALSFLYYNKYKRFNNASPGTSPVLDAHTLALTSLTLATKTTTNPRRLRSILLTAHCLLKPLRREPTLSPNASPEIFPKLIPEPLTIPSSHYDNLRATLVRAELIHLRVLKFELRLPLPFEYLPRYLERALGVHNIGAESNGMLEDYDSWEREHKDEDGVVGLMETRVGRAARAKVVDACKNYKVANFYPARAIAAASVRATFPGNSSLNAEKWLEHVTSGKVDRRDCYEIMCELEEDDGSRDGCPRLDDVTTPILRPRGFCDLPLPAVQTQTRSTIPLTSQVTWEWNEATDP